MLNLNVTNPSTNDSWKMWFSSRPSTKFINDSAKARLLKTFNCDIDKAECKLSLLKYDQTVFLFKQNLGINKVNIFHHLKRIGGNLYTPEEKFGAI